MGSDVPYCLCRSLRQLQRRLCLRTFPLTAIGLCAAGNNMTISGGSTDCLCGSCDSKMFFLSDITVDYVKHKNIAANIRCCKNRSTLLNWLFNRSGIFLLPYDKYVFRSLMCEMIYRNIQLYSLSNKRSVKEDDNILFCRLRM